MTAMRATTFTPYLAPVRKVDVHVTGRRIVATLVDGLVIGSLYGVMTALFGSVTRTGDHAEWTGTLPSAAAVAYALLVIGYYLVLEHGRGQTLGKMVVGIRVIDRATGGRPGLKAVAIRTALRLVDGFASYLVAFVCTLASVERQRLGDRAARTLVVASR
jgi:uncharacterized RDD family membrane protein YckC